jgi:hypothetical protein
MWPTFPVDESRSSYALTDDASANVNVNTSSSYYYDDSEANCRRYGRLNACESARWDVSR